MCVGNNNAGFSPWKTADFRKEPSLTSPSSQRKLGSSAFGAAKTLDPSFRWDDGETRLDFSQKNNRLSAEKRGDVSGKGLRPDLRT
jgi:hypothetical protein